MPSCECQLGQFDCESLVRQFLAVDRDGGGLDQEAMGKLIEKLEPNVRLAVSRILRPFGLGRLVDDAVQETLLKLCRPEKTRTWWEASPRPRFCVWVYVVAANTARDLLRKETGGPEIVADCSHIAADEPGDEQGAGDARRQLRGLIIRRLAQLPVDWQLVFYMRFAYTEPSTAEVASALGVSEETVFYRLREIKKRVARHCPLLSVPGIEDQAPVGRLHPFPGFDTLPRAKQAAVNLSINGKVLAPRPLPEKLAFYMRYSPLAVEVHEMAPILQETQDRVNQWLVAMEGEIRALCVGEGCDA